MAVGSITGGISCTANQSTYIQLSWNYSGTVSGFAVTFTDAAGGSITSAAVQSNSVTWTSSNVVWQYTGLTAGHTYSIVVVPVNGTSLGTSVSYVNSGTGNKVTIPATTPTTGGGSTPPPTGGSTSTNSQVIFGSPNKISKTITNIPVGGDWLLVARVKKSNGDGTFQVSDWASLPYTSGTTGSGGVNLTTILKGTDLRLIGGSIFATSTTDPLPSNLGALDLTITTPPKGKGIILNQTGLGSYADGTQEFFLDATSGKAFFAGRIDLGTNGMKIGPGVNPANSPESGVAEGTRNGIYINSTNYWYDDGSFGTTFGNFVNGVTGNKAVKPGPVSNLHATFNADLSVDVTFNFDTNAGDGVTYSNKNIWQFNFILQAADSTKKVIVETPNTSSISQSYNIPASQIQSLFNMTLTQLTVGVNAQDIFGNIGPTVTSSTASAPFTLPVPVITVSPINNGYQVNAANVPTSDNSYYDILIEEYIDTPPTTVNPGNVTYSQAAPETKLNPANIITSTTAHRWVRARYRDKANRLSDASVAHDVTPTNPVANNLNTTPPNEVTVGIVNWVGDNIQIHYSLPSTNPGVRFIISLTTNYSPYSDLYTGYFYLYPDGTGIATITKDMLLGQFGHYYKSFKGIIKSADSADLRSNGASFSVPTKTSAISSVTPDLASINIFPVPSGYAVQPTLISDAQYLEVYASTIPFGSSDPDPATYVGSVSTINIFNTTYEISPYARHYLKFRYAGYYDDFSLFSAQTYADPTNPTLFSTTPPAVPAVTLDSAGLTTAVIDISTTDTILTKGYFVSWYEDMNMDSMIMNMVPSTSALTSYIIPNLKPNTKYHISAQAYNDSNILSNSSTDLVVTTTSPTLNPPLGLTVSGISYGILASWSAPTTSPTPIAQYGVSVYKVISGSPALLFTEQYTTGTTYSISGLSPNTTYYVKVYAKDIYGNESVAIQSANVSLNGLGGTSNGLPPTSSPAATVTPLFGALQVNWSTITNSDLVTYEIHISTSSNFVPERPGYGLVGSTWVSTPGNTSNTTKYIETVGTFAVIKTLADVAKTPLNYASTYYVKIVAKDYDGAAAPGTAGSGTPSKIDNGDIAANAIRANVIQAGSITADKIVTDALFANQTISVGQSTSVNRIKLDATLISQNTTGYSNPTAPIYSRMYIGGGYYNDAGTQFYADSLGRLSLSGSLTITPGSTVPTNANSLTWDGSALTISGQIIAQSGYFNGAITVNGLNPTTAMKIGRAVDGTHDGIHLDSYNYWWTSATAGTPTFKIGAAGVGVSWTPSSQTFSVVGAITAQSGNFTGPVTIDSTATNAGLWVVTSTGGVPNYNSGPRVIINKNGIYSYDFGATSSTAPSTQINFATVAGQNTFYTTNAQIADWYVSGAKIENNAPAVRPTGTGSLGATTITVSSSAGITNGMYVLGTGIGNNATVTNVSGTTITLSVANSASVSGTINFYIANFTGLSASGTYAFWAGSPAPGGSSLSKFTVTPTGTITARDLIIYGDGTANSNTGIQIGGTTAANSPFVVKTDGSLYATSATIVGNINASSGIFSGNVAITTNGNMYGGTTVGTITNVVGTGSPTNQVTYSVTNTLAAGNKVIVSGLTPSGYNGTFTVLSATSGAFVVTNSTTGTATGTGIVSNVTTGFILNNVGLTFNNGTTNITAATGLLTTTSAKIGNWSVDGTTISSNGITLNSAIATGLGAITVNAGSYYVGITPASANAPGDVVLWAGANTYATRGSAKFYVTADGTLHASGASISGSVEITEGPTYTVLNGKASTDSVTVVSNSVTALTTEVGKKAATADVIAKGGAAADINSNTTTIKGGLVRTGAIQSTTYTAPSGSIYSGNGMSIVLDNEGSIISKNFVIDSSGNAYFKGTLTGSAGKFGTVTIDSNGISSTNFSINSSGTASFTGDISATSGYFGDTLANGWLISGGTLVGNTPSGEGSQIVLDAKNGKITGGQITGTVVVGNRVASSSSSTRVELINAATDSLRAVIGGSVKGHVLGYGNSTTGGMVMMAGSTADANTTSGHVRVLPNYAILSGTSTNYVEATGSQINIRGGSTGIYLAGSGSVYMQSGDTTASNANVFINSTSGLLARSTSSRKYKTDIETISFSDNVIKQLRPVKYHGIKDMERGDSTWYTGLIAEEVANIPGLELLVNYNEDGSPEAVNYAGLSVVVASVVSRILERLDKAGI